MARIIRGQVSFGSATREAFRRGRSAVRARRERALLSELAARPAQLRPEFQTLSATELLEHFRNRSAPSFLPGFVESTASAQKEFFPREMDELIKAAELITKEHRWPLLGFGQKSFGDPINWLHDPLSEPSSRMSFHTY